ncbi:DiNV CH01M ORF27-like protein [Mauternbach virus]|uniref:DiNV CH01M ORF27-like protein n=1 Tax=Mauternbach virus TaxID=2486603 RepID=A0A3G3E7F5_9VIRU|nr:DiNV CH01M ORF27-like protein [Mauternbach virus]AYP97910.1 DiNV CH01M ORF27-like protein [Mauternbach virus]
MNYLVLVTSFILPAILLQKATWIWNGGIRSESDLYNLDIVIDDGNDDVNDDDGIISNPITIDVSADISNATDDVDIVPLREGGNNNNNNEATTIIDNDSCNNEHDDILLKLPAIDLTEKYDGQRFKNIVLDGGNAKAISYIGAFKAFADLGYFQNDQYTFAQISGTSTSCLMGFIMALDIHPQILETLVYNLNVVSQVVNFNLKYLLDRLLQENDQNANETSWFENIKHSYNLLNRNNDFIRLWKYQNSPGLSNERALLRLLYNHILKKSPHYKKLKTFETITFNNIYKLTGHKIACFVTNLSKKSLIELSYNETPNENIFNAIYASLTIPGIFKPLQNDDSDILIDGAYLNNFPISIIDSRNTEHMQLKTLGLSLNTESDLMPINNNDDNDNVAATATTTTMTNTITTTTAAAAAAKNNNNNPIKNGKSVNTMKNEANSNLLKNNEKNCKHFVKKAKKLQNYTLNLKEIDTLEYAQLLHKLLLAKSQHYQQQQQQQGNKHLKQNIIYLDSPIEALSYNISSSMISMAINRAYLNVIKFFK